MIFASHLYKIVLNHSRCSVKIYQKHNQSKSFLILCVKYSTTTSTANTNQPHSFVASYLMNSCGLSIESALSVSKRVNFETPDRPDSVLSFLKNHGFSKKYISDIVGKVPSLLLRDAEKTLLPKFEFFYSKGASSIDLVKIFSGCPPILCRSLEKHIIPTYDFLKNLIKSDEKTVRSIQRCPSVIYHGLQTYVMPNIKILQNHGVPESGIIFLLGKHPKTLMRISSEHLNGIVGNVKAIGFNPSRMNFVRAIRVIRGMTASTWDRKVHAYERWGWSKETVLLAFGKHPGCMAVSENKIDAIIDFFVAKMGCDATYIAQHPVLLSLSLEKRIEPRYTIIQVLLSNGLIKQETISTLLLITDELFEQKLVTLSQNEAPHLLKLYKEKLDL